MFSKSDIKQLQQRNINVEVANEQLTVLQSGLPSIKLINPVTLNKGIIKLDEKGVETHVKYYDKFKTNMKIAKFIPASGAATRMFKAVHRYIDAEDKEVDKSTAESIKDLMRGAKKLPYYNELAKILAKEGKDLDRLINEKAYHGIMQKLVSQEGLNLGAKPKAMIFFHTYDSINRTALEEHMLEAVRYGVQQDKQVTCHFTLSPDHIEMAENIVNSLVPEYNAKYGVKMSVSFSIQSHATDTLALDSNEEIVRSQDGKLLFRPGGHGALMDNLNSIDADIVFIKNIDNVAHERFLDIQVKYKKALAGVLLNYQKKISNFLHKLNRQRIKSDAFLMEVTYFVKNKLGFLPPEEYTNLEPEDKVDYLIKVFNRPLRVCGVVKNTGEHGGVPFWVENSDGSVGLQIIEEAQVNPNDKAQKKIFETSTHFNPVDIVCYLKDMQGRKYDLRKYVNKEAGIITRKTYEGKDIKVLEHPGLWNGGMWHWNTIFVEVPLETFNPVKTFTDLLNPGHQGA